MAIINSQSLTVKKLYPMFKSRSKVTVKVTRSNSGYHRKSLVIRNTYAKYKALPLSTNELWPMLKFFESISKVTVKVTCSKFMVQSERHYHKEHTCQISMPYLLG